MGRYCTAEQVAIRFRKVTSITSYPVRVESEFVLYAESYLDQKLGPYFTTPFSSNNVTATDLAVDLSYAKIIMYDDAKKFDSIMKSVGQRIDDLITGTSAMVTSSGDQLLSTGEARKAFSTTEDYHSAFGLGDELLFMPSSDQLSDEESARW